MPKPPQSGFVIGSGPNGLTAAIVLAQAGLRVTIFEAEPIVGGGARSAELTLAGFVHDICSAVHPLAVSSPAFASFPLAQHGLEWIHPPVPLAHPLDNGEAVVLERSLEGTSARLGADGPVYRRALRVLVKRWPELMTELLQPVLHFPSRPLLLARWGALAPWPAAAAARLLFRAEPARALFAGAAAHSILPLQAPGSAAFGWVLAAAAHAAGWPIPRGGAQNIANALASYFRSLGGEIVTRTKIRSLEEIDRSSPRPRLGSPLILCDVAPRQFLALAGDRIPPLFRRQLERYRYGPAAFKIDWALRAPIPWQARECAQAGTVHVGGTLEEIAASEKAAWEGTPASRPFVLVAQPSLFDSSRAPEGHHTAWAYCHTPNSCREDLTERIERQIERFAPGFKDCIMARHTFPPAELERHNANLVGGDITGGANTLRQLVFRPTPRLYRTPLAGVYLCSASTPPGGGVHGMCGFHAAKTALKDHVEGGALARARL